MSNSQPARDGETDRGQADGTARRGADGGEYGTAEEYGTTTGDGWTQEELGPSLAEPIRKTCFWAAIVLPFLYVPLLLVGLTTPARAVGFFTLLGVNLIALYVGHAHRRGDDTDGRKS